MFLRIRMHSARAHGGGLHIGLRSWGLSRPCSSRVVVDVSLHMHTRSSRLVYGGNCSAPPNSGGLCGEQNTLVFFFFLSQVIQSADLYTLMEARAPYCRPLYFPCVCVCVCVCVFLCVFVCCFCVCFCVCVCV